MGILQRRADFEVDGFTLDRASLGRRPDAVSSDYQAARCVGPTAAGDVSLGLLVRVWEAYVVHGETTHTVYLRHNTATIQAGGGSWSAATELFTFTGAAIDELDLGFDQQGRAFVVAERATGTAGAPQVWARWFDVGEADFVFEAFADGRTPRVLLDDPTFSAESDVLVFYISETGPAFLVQSEVFATPHAVPTTGWGDVATEDTGITLGAAEDTYLEDVVMGPDRRIHVFASDRNQATGIYRLLVATTEPYPFRLPAEALDVGSEALDFVLQVILLIEVLTTEATDVTSEALEFETQSVIIIIIIVLPAEAIDVASEALEFETQSVIVIIVLPAEAIDVASEALEFETQTTVVPIVVTTEAIDVASELLFFTTEIV